jgi:hypothetical protein
MPKTKQKLTFPLWSVRPHLPTVAGKGIHRRKNMKARCILRCLVVLLALATVLAGAVTLFAQERDERMENTWPRHTLVGTWYWQTLLPVAPNVTVPFPALVTYHRDGTVDVSDGLMFGGLPTNVFRYTPARGVWERIGPRQFQGTTLFLRFDATTGKLVGIARSRSHIEFGEDGDHIKGTIHLDVLNCVTPVSCPDPLSAPTADWLPYGPLSDYSFVAERMHVVPLPE